MKKVLLTIGILIVALSVMAPAPDKAEKLKVNDQDYDRDPAQFIVKLSCQFGAATAGEHAGFKIGAALTVQAGENTYELTGERDIQKVEGAEKDADNFIAIEPLRIDWEEGKFFEGDVSVTTWISLVGPSGNVQGEVVETTTKVNIPPPVKVDDEDWDYDPKLGIIVPMLAHADIVDTLMKEGYWIEVDVKVWNTGEIPEFAGSGKGSTDIVKVDEQDYDYVLIEPVFAKLTSVEWNGDDDGSGIVSGTIMLFDSDDILVSITTFENQTVGFVIHTPLPCEDCAPGETVP